jgi:hypothetical protein
MELLLKGGARMNVKMSRATKLLTVVLFLILSASLLACSSGPLAATTIKIVRPQDGSTIPTGPVTVAVDVTNFTLIDKLGQKKEPGQGHIHYYIDVQAPTTAGQPAVTANGTWFSTPDLEYTWPNVGPGQHTFSAELVNNDSTPLDPPVVFKVTATTAIMSPGISIISPADGSSVQGGNVTVSLEVNGFDLASNNGQGNIASQGHIRYSKDVDPLTNPGEPQSPDTSVSTWEEDYTWSNLSAGLHSFSAELVNNDGTPLNPRVFDTVAVTVQ